VFEFPQITNVIKIRSVGAELFDADGQTEMMKIIFAFLKLSEMPDIFHFVVYSIRSQGTYIRLFDWKEQRLIMK
jgi:hypothetical protein